MAVPYCSDTSNVLTVYQGRRAPEATLTFSSDTLCVSAFCGQCIFRRIEDRRAEAFLRFEAYSAALYF